jgi:hypothetical protein
VTITHFYITLSNFWKMIMRAKRAVDIIAIELRDANQNEARISSYLRSRQAQGKELKSEVMTAMTAFFETYAIADDPLCSPSDLHDSWIRSLNLLSGQMSSLSACVERKIHVQPESWRRFALVPTGQPMMLSSTGSIAPLPQAIASSPPAVNIPQAIEPAPSAEIAWGDIDTEDMTDQEYKAHMAKRPRMNPITLPND